MDEQDQPKNSDQDSNRKSDEPETIDAASLLPLIEAAQRSLDELKKSVGMTSGRIMILSSHGRVASQAIAVDQEGAKIIEGTFDGQNMLGPDGKQYSVPANYASKSKLVEGDVLKLTITKDGSFIYKQIGPVERQRIVGQLTRDEVTGEYRVLAESKNYKVLLASITYFKGEPGDEVVVLVPSNGESRWAAVENIIKQGSLTGDVTV